MKHKLLHLQSLVTVALCVILSLTFNSCSDDDDEPKSDSIVGTWRLTIRDSDGYESSLWYCQYHFKSDGTLEVKDWYSDSKEPSSYEAKGTYSISNQFITIKIDDEWTEIYEFNLSDNKLIIYDYEDEGPNIFYRV